MTTYKIMRYFQNESPAQTVVRGQTLEQAQAHCSREDTHGPDWLDGYTEEVDFCAWGAANGGVDCGHNENDREVDGIQFCDIHANEAEAQPDVLARFYGPSTCSVCDGPHRAGSTASHPLCREG